MHSSSLLFVAGLLGAAAAQSHYDTRSLDITNDIWERALAEDALDLESRGFKTGVAKALNKIKGGPPIAKSIDRKPAKVHNKLQKKPPAAKAPKAPKTHNKLQKKPPKNIGKNFRRDLDDDAIAQFVRDLEEAELEIRAPKRSHSKGRKHRKRPHKSKSRKLRRKHKKVHAEESE
ncbi:unnamed protein product [Clonostachys rosea f. rosea IK726]|jgi:hypothetical protein|uniref:Uncharacterized protein n=1 Tax=Clonostachys rosea f. rosea IK726 TaxID=1349383 RepID=A0ACA9TZ97_BIOOC|nr:unnamed protein product [Clonostachys rosea f. rosea IK726]